MNGIIAFLDLKVVKEISFLLWVVRELFLVPSVLLKCPNQHLVEGKHHTYVGYTQFKMDIPTSKHLTECCKGYPTHNFPEIVSATHLIKAPTFRNASFSRTRFSQVFKGNMGH